MPTPARSPGVARPSHPDGAPPSWRPTDRARRRCGLTKAALALGFAALGALAAPAAFAADEYVAVQGTGRFDDPPGDQSSLPQSERITVTQIAGRLADEVTGRVTLPFDFTFFGRLYPAGTTLSVSTNGWLAFSETTATAPADRPLPSADVPGGFVAALWDDLRTGRRGSVIAYTRGTAAAHDRVLHVTWLGMTTASKPRKADADFQVQLAEGTNEVVIAYGPGSVFTGTSWSSGISDTLDALAVGTPGTGNGRAGTPAGDWTFTPNAATVRGRLLRDRPVASAAGLGVTFETGIPVAGIDVELERDGVVAARARTDTDGNFVLGLAAAPDDGPYDVYVAASGAASRVVDAGGKVRRYKLNRTAPVIAADSPDLGTITLDTTVDAADASFRPAVNIQQAAKRAFDWADAAAAFTVRGTQTAATTFPRLDFRFTAGTAATGNRTAYVQAGTSAAASVNLHDAADNPDAWDDPVILRECGHHVLASIAAYPGAASRGWETATTAAGAFADGFATWFSCVVLGTPQFVDTKSATTATVLDLEAGVVADPAQTKAFTSAVARSFWDLVDPANEESDRYEGTAAGEDPTAYEIVSTIDRSGTVGDAEAFFTLWIQDAATASAATGQDTERAQSARIFIRSGVLADERADYVTSNDLPGEETVFSDASRRTGLVLQPHNEDRFTVPWNPSTPSPLAVTFTQSGTSRVRIEVLDDGGTVVAGATNDTVESETPQPVTAATPGDVAGTFTVRVVWLGATTSVATQNRIPASTTYSLSFTDAVRVRTVAFPTISTVGLRYVAEWDGAGGTAPYTLAIDADVPGLLAQPSARRLSGILAEAGTYAVRVTVTDALGVTASDDSFVIDVRPQLQNPPFFGIASGSDLASGPGGGVVGSGGIDPAWTTGPQPGAGLQIAAGSELMLTGTSGAPRVVRITPTAVERDPSVPPGTFVERPTDVVVSAVVDTNARVAVPDADYFGVWFDALEGSRANLRLVFSGGGVTPGADLVDDAGSVTEDGIRLIDHTGRRLDVSAQIRRSGRTVTLARITMPRTGRWFLILRNPRRAGPTPSDPLLSRFVGSCRMSGRVTPPTAIYGTAQVADSSVAAEVPFVAIGESAARILVSREFVPDAPMPSTIELVDPDGNVVPLHPRTLSGGRGLVVDRTFLDGKTGTWILRIRVAGPLGGPVHYRIDIDTLRTFSLF